MEVIGGLDLPSRPDDKAKRWANVLSGKAWGYQTIGI